jgi:hypothetical protein
MRTAVIFLILLRASKGSNPKAVFQGRLKLNAIPLKSCLSRIQKDSQGSKIGMSLAMLAVLKRFVELNSLVSISSNTFAKA